MVSAEDAKEFNKLIFAKKDESKLVTESKVELRALVREQNFSKSEERKTQLEEQITIVKEQSAQHDEKLVEIAGRISNRLSLIKEHTTLDSSSVLMGERTIQLNINYETLRKHAGYDMAEYEAGSFKKKLIICAAAFAMLVASCCISSYIVYKKFPGRIQMRHDGPMHVENSSVMLHYPTIGKIDGTNNKKIGK
ncbi:hypothetical protein [Rickettsia felis]|uniref:hypothetical protein n=1 Tax=Rickettsia felis TaxID=42862 RepID=UPI00057307C7|nr:hypothetical protein [Rickettsia felis]KHO02207.1 hypothetical protein JS55_08155 [Rickettsia felis str. LSU]